MHPATTSRYGKAAYRKNSLPTAIVCALLTLWLLIPEVSFSQENASAEFPSNRDFSFSPSFKDTEENTFPTSTPTSSRRLTKQNATMERPVQQNNRTTGSTTSAARTIGSLILVIGLILLGARVWRKHSPAANSGIPSEAIEILGQKPIEQRASLYLIRCGNRILVVGSSADGLQTLSEVTDPVEVDYLAGLCRRSEQESGFKQSLRSFFNRGPQQEFHSEQMDESSAETDDEISKLTARLQIDPSADRDQSLEGVHG